MSDSYTDDGELTSNDNVAKPTTNKITYVTIPTNENTYVANNSIVNSIPKDNAPAIGNPSTFIMCKAIKKGMETFAVQHASIMRERESESMKLFNMFSATVNNNVDLEALDLLMLQQTPYAHHPAGPSSADRPRGTEGQYY